MAVEWKVTLTVARRSSWTDFWLLNERGARLLLGAEAVNWQLLAHWLKLKALPVMFNTPQVAQMSLYAVEG